MKFKYLLRECRKLEAKLGFCYSAKSLLIPTCRDHTSVLGLLSRQAKLAEKQEPALSSCVRHLHNTNCVRIPINNKLVVMMTVTANCTVAVPWPEILMTSSAKNPLSIQSTSTLTTRTPNSQRKQRQYGGEEPIFCS